jgi:hypothetical protein
LNTGRAADMPACMASAVPRGTRENHARAVRTARRCPVGRTSERPVYRTIILGGAPCAVTVAWVGRCSEDPWSGFFGLRSVLDRTPYFQTCSE